MKTHNAENERIKHRYFTYLREAKRASEASIDKVAGALHRFESYTKFQSFKSFRFQQAIAFKRHLAEAKNPDTDAPLSKATLHGTLTALRNFFFWLADQPGYKRQIPYSSADYFNLSANEVRIARARRERPVPTTEQIRHVLDTMPAISEIDRRNRALIAFTLLTGARDNAIASFKLKHIDLEAGCVTQDAREVRTKNAKTFTTTFFPVGDDIRTIVEDWIAFLKTEKLWGLEEPLFPATRVALGTERQFKANGLDRKHWATTEPIRRIFRNAFEVAGLPYANPHSFRKTLALLGQKLCHSPEEMKAWSQNFGHENVLTTLTSYGRIGSERQAEIIRQMADQNDQTVDELEEIDRMIQSMRRKSRSPDEGRAP
jgi:integrase/recombinase XerD